MGNLSKNLFYYFRGYQVAIILLPPYYHICFAHDWLYVLIEGQILLQLQHLKDHRLKANWEKKRNCLKFSHINTFILLTVIIT